MEYKYSKQTTDVYCNGLYVWSGKDNDKEEALYLTDTLPAAFDIDHFTLSMEIYIMWSATAAAQDQNIITIDSSYRAFSLVTKNQNIYVRVNNGGTYFDTGIPYTLRKWMKIDCSYNQGVFTINGKTFKIGKLVSKGNKNISSTDFGRGKNFNGRIRNLTVTSEKVTKLPELLNKPDEVYCNGLYADVKGGEKSQFWQENLGENFNRHAFELSFDFKPMFDEKTAQTYGNIITLDHGWRAISLMTKGNTLYITTNNQRNYFNTGIPYKLGEWMHVDIYYGGGWVCVNVPAGGKNFAVGVLNDGNLDNTLSTKNYSNGKSFKGYIKNVVVNSKYVKHTPNIILNKKAEIECNGLYYYDNKETCKYMCECLGDKMNRKDFHFQFEFLAKKGNDKNDTIFSFDTSYRAIGIIMKDDKLAIQTNNQDNTFATKTTFKYDQWQKVDLYYNYGDITFNGEHIKVGDLQGPGNNCISSNNMSNGHSLLGAIRKLLVICAK